MPGEYCDFLQNHRRIEQILIKIKKNLFHLKKSIEKSCIDRCLCLDDLGTAEKVLSSSVPLLMSLGLTETEVRQIKSVISKDFAKPFITASDFAYGKTSKCQRIALFCRSLDQITRFGLPIRGITELYGESGSGKSQICLQLALNVQTPIEYGGLKKSTVFICTEDAFPSKRLCQMAHFHATKYQVKDNLLDSIFIEHISNSERLLDCITNRLPALLQNHSIGLIIIDSIAGVFRLEANAISRANEMRQLVLALQSLSNTFECATVCVNQITASFKNNRIQPSLGLAWSNLVTTRILVRKTDKMHNQITIRSFEVIFSPELPRNKAEFVITENGIE